MITKLNRSVYIAATVHITQILRNIQVWDAILITIQSSIWNCFGHIPLHNPLNGKRYNIEESKNRWKQNSKRDFVSQRCREHSVYPRLGRPSLLLLSPWCPLVLWQDACLSPCKCAAKHQYQIVFDLFRDMVVTWLVIMKTRDVYLWIDTIKIKAEDLFISLLKRKIMTPYDATYSRYLIYALMDPWEVDSLQLILSWNYYQIMI